MYIKHRSFWFRTKIANRFKILKKHGWRFLLFYRCLKRKKATLLLREFFTEFSRLRLLFLMSRYRANALRLQKYMGSFLAVTNARVFVLQKRWAKVENIIKIVLVNRLVEDRLNFEIAKQKAREQDVAWKVCIVLFCSV